MSIEELKKLIGNKKLIAGSQRAVKELKKGTVKELFIASNCPDSLKTELEMNARMEKAAVSKLALSSEDLGILVKKPFSVAVVSLLK